MIVEVEAHNYFISDYGNIKVDSEVFRLGRRFPWQKWVLLTEFGCGYQPGDKWDRFPIKPNKEYTASFDGSYTKVKVRVIGSA